MSEDWGPRGWLPLKETPEQKVPFRVFSREITEDAQRTGFRECIGIKYEDAKRFLGETVPSEPKKWTRHSLLKLVVGMGGGKPWWAWPYSTWCSYGFDDTNREVVIDGPWVGRPQARPPHPPFDEDRFLYLLAEVEEAALYRGTFAFDIERNRNLSRAHDALVKMVLDAVKEKEEGHD